MANNALAEISMADESEAWLKKEDYSENERRLWLAVIHRAVLDFRGEVENYNRRRAVYLKESARRWLWSNDRSVGSLLWVLDVTGLRVSADSIRKNI